MPRDFRAIRGFGLSVAANRGGDHERTMRIAVLFVTSAIVTSIVAAATLAAAPSVGYMYNTASYIPPGLPGYGIAQGSFFVLYGSGMGPATIANVLQ